MGVAWLNFFLCSKNRFSFTPCFSWVSQKRHCFLATVSPLITIRELDHRWAHLRYLLRVGDERAVDLFVFEVFRFVAGRKSLFAWIGALGTRRFRKNGC